MTDEIKQYFDLLEQLVADEHQQEKINNKKLYDGSKLMLILRATIMTLATTMALLYLLVSLFKLAFLGAALMFNIILLFLAFAVLLTKAYFKKGSGLSVSRWFGVVDAKYLPLLCALPTQTLALGRLELEHGRDWFVKGLGSLIGFIDKVGLVPSILSLGALWAIPEKIPDWGLPLMVACILLYSTALLLLPYCRRLDRMIALTELALKMKNNDDRD